MAAQIQDKRKKMLNKFDTELYGSRPPGLTGLAEDIIRIDGSMNDRYVVFNFQEFIRQNADKSISSLINTLSSLEEYGYRLIRTKALQQTDWREISKTNSMFRERIANTKGAHDILKTFGYTNETKDKLTFSEYVKEPIKEAVVTIIMDIIVAREELDSFELYTHPRSQEVVNLRRNRGNGTNQNIPTYSPTSSADMQSYSKTYYIKPFHKPRSIYPSYEPLDLPSCVLCGENKDEIECKDCGSFHCIECDREWHQHPKRKDHTNRIQQRGSVKTIGRETEQDRRTKNPTLTSPASPSDCHDSLQLPAKNKHPIASIMGESQNVFNRSFDFTDMPPCSLCGESKGIIECKDCGCSHCTECDREWHRHPKRKHHTNRVKKQIERTKSYSSKSSSDDADTLGQRYVLPGNKFDKNKSQVEPTQKENRLPKVDSSSKIYDKTLEDIHRELSITEESLKLCKHEPNEIYEELLKKRDFLAKQWQDVVNVKLNSEVTTAQNRETELKRNDSVPVGSEEHTIISNDFSLNTSLVARNIRRPPIYNDSSLDPQIDHHCNHQDESVNCLKCPVIYKDSPLSRKVTLPSVNNRKSLEMVENYYSNDATIMDGWECPHCTFVNKQIDRIICEMCSKTTPMIKRGTSLI